MSHQNCGCHVVAFRPHTCRFGSGYRAECLDCHYVSPVLPWVRANKVAKEHERKLVDAGCVTG
jgi:hypothetical protein